MIDIKDGPVNVVVIGLATLLSGLIAFGCNRRQGLQDARSSCCWFGWHIRPHNAKAYVKGIDRFGGYVKTILYYVTMAVSASGVAYATGDLFGKLLDDLGWFQPAQVDASRVSSWASY
ncbi:hypothetical protein SASPL_157716 [Salvia splendens]|uniref:Uncharacterized protein n=1 Tax=Salvia splendens TaxID=180675 RepID=A0A8X8VUJ9_SALSN|nr:hypothetical protein SASPL_157716 [Salvia splendens]